MMKNSKATAKGVYRKNPDIVHRVIDEETILVPTSRKKGQQDCIYTLNETGAYIWGLIDGKIPLSQIAEKQAREYGISRDRADADLSGFISDLESSGCIEPVK